MTNLSDFASAAALYQSDPMTFAAKGLGDLQKHAVHAEPRQESLVNDYDVHALICRTGGVG
jgi:hypothetical protein